MLLKYLRGPVFILLMIFDAVSNPSLENKATYLVHLRKKDLVRDAWLHCRVPHLARCV